MKIRIKVPRYVFIKRLFSSSLRKKEYKLIVYLKKDKSVIVGLILKKPYKKLQPRLMGVLKEKNLSLHFGKLKSMLKSWRR